MLTHFSISQKGERHIVRGEPCQDYSTSCRIYLDRFNYNLVLAAIADGVGSCMFSQYGAETAVMSFVSCMTHNLSKASFELTDESIENLFKHAFHYALSQVVAKAKEMELPFIEFDSTLTGVLFDGSNLWFGHVGDDGIVVLYTDGTYEMITERHEGEELGELFPLCHEEKWQFGKASKEVASLALMTDGVLNYCVDSEVMRNRVYFPFLEPALTTVLETDEQAEEQKKEWDAYLKESPEDMNSFRKYVTDDISFVLVENSESVAALPEIIFDRDKWDADTQKRRQELYEALYGDYRKFKERQQRQSLQDVQQPLCSLPTAVDDDQTLLQETESAFPLSQSERCKPPRDVVNTHIPQQPRISTYMPMPMQGKVIHKPSQAQISAPILEVFETVYAAGREIMESFSQMMDTRKAKISKPSVQNDSPESGHKNGEPKED